MLWADVRLAVRSLRKSPAFTAVAVLTIGLSLGANAAIFSFLDGVLLKPLPYPEPERLVQLWEKPPGGTRNGISALNFQDWQRQATSFTAMAAQTGKIVTMSSAAGEPRQLRLNLVSAPYFDVLGVRPALGRLFVPGEDQLGNDHVLVLSQRAWRSEFGGDPGLVGREVVLDGERHTVVGVLPAGEFDRRWNDGFMPLAFPRDAVRNFHYMSAIARLKPGVSLEQAQAEMSRIAGAIAEQYPAIKKDWGATVDRLLDRVVGPQLRTSLVVLMAAVGAVLLIGCANLANLLLARATERARETSIRVALGAGRWRLVRQLLTESLLLSCAGGLVGLALGVALFRGIRSQLPPFSLPAQAEVGIDPRVAGFLALLTILTTVLFGLAPALQASRCDPIEALKEGGRSGSVGRRKARLRNGLVVAQVALAFVLVSGAGLLIRSFARLTSVDAGFDATSVVTMGFLLQMEKDTDGDRLTGYLGEAIEAVRAVPGVQEVALTSALPLQGWGFGMPFRIEGRATEPSRRPACYFKIVTPGYFRALGMKLRKGRGLSEADAQGAAPVLVANETFVRRFLSTKEPIGQHVMIERIVTGKRELGPEVPWEVVGVVADEKVSGLDDTSAGVYVSYAQSPIVGVSLLARGAGDPQALIASIRRAIWAVNRNQALPNPRTLEEIKSDSLGQNRLRTILIAAFAGLALSMAALGVYGVLSYVTAQRTLELGVRAALGASATDLVRLVVRAGSTSVLLGLIIGAYGAVGLTRWLREILFEVDPTDPATMAVTAGVLILVGWAACYVPARRAACVDPMTALRTE